MISVYLLLDVSLVMCLCQTLGLRSPLKAGNEEGPLSFTIHHFGSAITVTDSLYIRILFPQKSIHTFTERLFPSDFHTNKV